MTRTYGRREQLTDANIGHHILSALQPDSGDEHTDILNDPFAPPTEPTALPARGVKSMHELLAAGSASRMASDLDYALEDVERLQRGTREWSAAVWAAALLMGAGGASAAPDRVVQEAKIRASGYIQRLVSAVLGGSSTIDGKTTDMTNALQAPLVEEFGLLAAVLRKHCALLRRIDHFIAPQSALYMTDTLLQSSSGTVAEDALFVAARACEAMVAASVQPERAPQFVVRVATQRAQCPETLSKDVASILNALVLWRLVHATPDLLSALLQKSAETQNAVVIGTLVGLTGPDCGASMVAECSVMLSAIVKLAVDAARMDPTIDALVCSLAINMCDRSRAARLAMAESVKSGLCLSAGNPMRAAMWGIVLHDTCPNLIQTSDRRIVSEALCVVRTTVHDAQSLAVLDAALAVFPQCA